MATPANNAPAERPKSQLTLEINAIGPDTLASESNVTFMYAIGHDAFGRFAKAKFTGDRARRLFNDIKSRLAPDQTVKEARITVELGGEWKREKEPRQKDGKPVLDRAGKPVHANFFDSGTHRFLEGQQLELHRTQSEARRRSAEAEKLIASDDRQAAVAALLVEGKKDEAIALLLSPGNKEVAIALLLDFTKTVGKRPTKVIPREAEFAAAVAAATDGVQPVQLLADDSTSLDDLPETIRSLPDADDAAPAVAASAAPAAPAPADPEPAAQVEAPAETATAPAVETVSETSVETVPAAETAAPAEPVAGTAVVVETETAAPAVEKVSFEKPTVHTDPIDAPPRRLASAIVAEAKAEETVLPAAETATTVPASPEAAGEAAYAKLGRDIDGITEAAPEATLAPATAHVADPVKVPEPEAPAAPAPPPVPTEKPVPQPRPPMPSAMRGFRSMGGPRR